MTEPAPRVTAVVLAYGAEPWLERSVHALLASKGVAVDVVLVDNGCTDGGVERLRGVAGITHVGAGENLGFSGGCDLGAESATGEYLALVNGDLAVDPDAIAALVAVAARPEVGVAQGSVRLADDPDRLNSAGNEIHFLGFSWCGGFGDPASAFTEERDVTGAMGAFALLRTTLWRELGGFDPHYFAFHEDAELSWRCWQRGLRVRYVPAAVGLHRYEFDRVKDKLYLSERNRLLLTLTAWETRTLVVLAPALLAMELATLVASVAGGWAGRKVRGWRWIVGNRRWLRDRRRRLQDERTVPDRDLAPLLRTRLRGAGNFPLPSILVPFDALLGGYWWVARRLLA